MAEIQQFPHKARPIVMKQATTPFGNIFKISACKTHPNRHENLLKSFASSGGSVFTRPVEDISIQQLNACFKCFYTLSTEDSS